MSGSLRVFFCPILLDIERTKYVVPGSSCTRSFVEDPGVGMTPGNPRLLPCLLFKFPAKSSPAQVTVPVLMGRSKDIILPTADSSSRQDTYIKTYFSKSVDFTLVFLWVLGCTYITCCVVNGL